MNQKPISVLLIEDDADFTQLMQMRLGASKAPPFTLECRPDLTTGLKRLSEGGIEVVLLDLNLKGSKGLETLTKVHAQATNLPVIVLTGQYDESMGPETLKLGAQDYFLKGKIEMSALTRSIQYSIERKRYEQELQDAYTRIKQLLAFLPSILIGVDQNDVVTHWNTVAERTFGVTSLKAIGRPLTQCGIDWDYSILEKGIAECRAKKALVRLKDDVSFKYPDGRKGLLGFVVNPVKDIAKDSTDALLYGADVTERRQVEARLKHNTAQSV